MAITIKDIARIAGVSPSTVSRVLSGSPRISRETVQRVQAIMTEHGYRPNQLARSLVNRKASIIAAVLPSSADTTLSDPFFFDVLRGISVGASAKGYHVLLSTGIGATDEKEAVASLARSGFVGGVILLAGRLRDETSQFLLNERFPFVVLGHPTQESEINWVDNDNVEAGRDLAAHLLERGYRRIAFIGRDERFRVNEDRLTGFRLAHTQANVCFDEALIFPITYGNDLTDAAYIAQIMEGENAPDAFIACNDQIALELLQMLRELHIAVPDQVAVAGFNNTKAGMYCTPGLTSIELNPAKLGEETFSLLTATMEDVHLAPTHIRVSHDLIIRSSSSECR